MTASILQERSSENLTSASSIALAFTSTITAGSALHVIGLVNANVSMTFTDNNGGSYTALDNSFSAVSGVAIAHAVAVNHSSGATTVTLTLGGAAGAQAIWVREIGGVKTAPLDGHSESDTSGVSSQTASATNTAQPALVSALGVSISSQTQTATNSMTKDATGWNAGAASYHKRVTTAASQTAGFSVSATDTLYLAMTMLDEATSSDVTVALTGKSAAFTAGTVPPSSAIALAGGSAASAAGTLGAAPGVALTGQSAATASGSLTPSRTVALVGQSGSLAAGAITPTPTLALTGQSATSTAGSVTPALSAPVSGQGTVSTPGLLVPAASVAVSGQAASSSAGTVASGLSSALTGQGAALTPGTLAPAVALALTGQSAAVSSGTISAAGDVTVSLTGQSANFAAGTLTAVSDTTVAQPGPLDWPPDRIADTAFRRKKKRRQAEIEQPAAPVDPIRVGAIGAVEPVKTYDFRSLAELSGKSVDAFRAEIDQEIATLLADQQERDDEEALTLILAALED